MADEREQDPQETREWIDALDSVLETEGIERAHFLIEKLIDRARRSGAHLPYRATTAYVNTIRKSDEALMPGEPGLEHRIRSINRWNALAMVMRANVVSKELGGHLSSYASIATLLEVGFNHFFRAPTADHGGDLVYFQGHSAPGIYARAFLEGRLDEEELNRFRREVDGGGLSSYPHPWLMPDFWQFPTVSMGLSPLMAIYQARFMKYAHARGLIDADGRKVWAFMGDGEMDEPESLGAISLAAREELDNLIFVVNCNLQRLDGPVRGNGKIIQELEGGFRGAGWNVIKVIWGSGWDRLFAKDKTGLLLQRMEEALDGDYQNYKAKGGAYVREHFFGKYPELLQMVSDMTDDDIWRLDRGGHDPQKVYAAYHAATQHTGQPTVILAKTVKGYGLGQAGESVNIAHQMKKPTKEALVAFRDRYRMPIPDEKLEEAPFYKPDENSPEMMYLRERREALGGFLPQRTRRAPPLEVPSFASFASQTEGTGDREISTTMAFVRLLTALTRDANVGPQVVPIVPDVARTFGMEGLFRTLGIYAAKGQLYDPVDADQVMYYKEDAAGQILQEGITEAGGFSSWIAAATAYSSHGAQMLPFFIYYSMFGFQRVGDLAWAAGDSQARGFLLGGTSGRTTLAGEGLQHQDGHSQILASTIPNCRAYDPTFNYELAVIIHDGLERMVRDQENIFYYITIGNENYAHPPMPDGVRDGIVQGMYLFRAAAPRARTLQLLGSGAILREVIAAADLLEAEWDVGADVWSTTSFNELRRDGLEVQRWNLLHPEQVPRLSVVERCLGRQQGPVVAATDYMKIYADQIRPFVPHSYRVLGTDGYGRSDTREKLRDFFEVDRRWVVIAALKALADEGEVPVGCVSQAIARYGIDAKKSSPVSV
ncbi:MAG: pyruvate dehydrogenase (acetyl-transferring), homodimeric type [Deltaproteobacteria bacterium]|nr:pyruvate dehydrogenase (acetyl-transferring), homodimeric type [Deltaproteobacteria bacterium]MBW2362935.1 pyruvate dehydrogenase (acetyl-transferring), homodimeric type [Deltaproteobacteria bacterium]